MVHGHCETYTGSDSFVRGYCMTYENNSSGKYSSVLGGDVIQSGVSISMF